MPIAVAGIHHRGSSRRRLTNACPAPIASPVTAGTVHVGGSDVTRLDVAARLRAGLGRLTEDRWGSVVLGMSVEQNLVLEDLDRFRTGPFLSRRRVRAHAESLIERFDIRPPSCDLKTANFSGGNQQKIVIARELERDPDVLLVGQPTRGVDIGAIEFIHNQIVALRGKRQGQRGGQSGACQQLERSTTAYT